MIIIIILCVIGFAVSAYGLFVEKKIKKDPSYKPVCDISDKASCTKPFQSSFSRMFGISNTIVGMIFYAAIAFLVWLGLYQLVLIGSAVASFVSLYLAYILYAKIRTLCLICTITYLVNGALLLTSLWHVI